MFIAKRTTLKSEGRRPKVEGRKKAEFRVPKSEGRNPKAERGSDFGLRVSAFGGAVPLRLPWRELGL